MQFVLNTFSFLVWGALVMWMCAGFTMLEAGSVATKNASVICLKNIGVCSIAALTFYLVGYNIMFTGVEAGGWFGSLDLLYGPSEEERVLLGGDGSAAAAVVKKGHATMSDWLFQMVFLASSASIVSGTLAERVGSGFRRARHRGVSRIHARRGRPGPAFALIRGQVADGRTALPTGGPATIVREHLAPFLTNSRL